MASEGEDWLVVALKKLLRPVVRFGLRRSLKFQDFLGALKEVFVEVAEKELESEEEKITVSRLSVFTGLHRPDVKRIVEGNIPPAEGHAQNIVARVAMQWSQDKRFCTKQGKPRVLSYTGEENDFRDLVQVVSKNYSPRTILEEMRRLALIEESAQGVKLIRTEVWVESDKATVDLLAQDVQGLFHSVEENMGDPELPNLHIRTHYDNIFLADLPELRNWLFVEGKKFHQKVREKLAQHDKDIDIKRSPSEAGGGKIAVTAFSTWAGKDDEL